MRKFANGLAVWLVLLAGARAQVSVEVVVEQQQFLPGESLPIAVRIINRSGQTLKFGADNEWLGISVEARDGSVVRRNCDPDVKAEFTLETSQRATRRLDLQPCFSFTRPGRYQVRATVRVAPWDQQFASAPAEFDIISGARRWEQEFGVPGTSPGQPPEMRKYILQQANYLKSELRLYLRVTDATEGRVYRVLNLGPMVSFGRPEPQLDEHSNVHLLFQRGRTICSYVVVNPNGEIVVRQTWEIAGRRPRLQPNQDGKLVVMGGLRRLAQDDIPPSPVELNLESADMATSPVADTNVPASSRP